MHRCEKDQVLVLRGLTVMSIIWLQSYNGGTLMAVYFPIKIFHSQLWKIKFVAKKSDLFKIKSFVRTIKYSRNWMLVHILDEKEEAPS